MMGIMGVMSVGGADWTGVAEQAAEDVGEEIREQGGLLEVVRAAGGDEGGPIPGAWAASPPRAPAG
jgi:hypothetical protein